MQSMHNDITARIEYNPVNNKSTFQRNVVGAHAYIELDEKDYTDTDANTIYVDTASGNDSTGLGTKAAPYKTYVKGANECTALKSKVIVLNSATVAEDMTAITSALFQGFFADTGITARYSPRVLHFTPSDGNSIFVSKDSGDDSTGDGTRANPYATLGKANAEVDGTNSNIVIIDDETYNESLDVSALCTAIVADVGFKPVIDCLVTSDNITLDWTQLFTDTIVNDGYYSTFVYDDMIGVMYLDSPDWKVALYNLDGDQTENLTVAGASICVTDNYFAVYYASGPVVYKIYSKAGVLQRTITLVTGSSIVSEKHMSGDLFVIVYSVSTDIFYVIYDLSDGSIYQAAKSLPEKGVGSDGFILDTQIHFYDSNSKFYYLTNQNNTNYKLRRFSIDGTEIGSATTITSIAYMRVGCVFSDILYVLKYESSGVVKLQSFGTDGAEVAVVSVGSSLVHNGLTIDANNLLHALYNDTSKYYDKIYGSDLTLYETKDLGAVGSVVIYTPIAYNNGYLGLVTHDSSQTVVTVVNPYTWIGFDIQAACKINGLSFSQTYPLATEAVIKSSAACDIINCDILECDQSSRTGTAEGRPFDITGKGTIKNSYIKGNSGKSLITADEADVTYNIYERNSGLSQYALEINGEAASSGDITVEHNTFYSNYAGLRLVGNGGTNEVVKNNIFYENSVKDIYAQTALTIINTVYNGVMTGITIGAQVVKANALFVNDGAYDESDTNLHLKKRILGYFADSPAYGLADDTLDAGAYNDMEIGDVTSWTAFTFEKPVHGLQRWLDPAGSAKNIASDGTIRSKASGWTQYLELVFVGIRNSELTNVLLMAACTDRRVRIYLDYTTNPTTYEEYKFIPAKIAASAKHFRLNDTGAQDIKLLFGRKYA